MIRGVRRFESGLCWLMLVAAGCAESARRDSPRSAPSAAASATSSVRSAFMPPQASPAPRPGMVWIPPGPLVAGTPPDRLPRIADEEMAGEQVILKGYYID